MRVDTCPTEGAATSLRIPCDLDKCAGDFMTHSIAQPNLPTPLLVTEKPRKQAKAALRGVRKAEIERQWVKWGGCIGEVQGMFRLTLQEFAAALGDKDERQVARWIAGTERPQIEAVLAKARFAGPMLIALARVEQGVEVDTVIHVRRTA